MYQKSSQLVWIYKLPSNFSKEFVLVYQTQVFRENSKYFELSIVKLRSQFLVNIRTQISNLNKKNPKRLPTKAHYWESTKVVKISKRRYISLFELDFIAGQTIIIYVFKLVSLGGWVRNHLLQGCVSDQKLKQGVQLALKF